MRLILLIPVLVVSSLVTSGAADSPAVRAPWRLDLLASAPDVRHPSVVCAAPDGRIFVAEDPMDISAPANAAHGRVITFHPDGRRTVFATNLFAIFGMQYLEGKLYVLHNPRFTTFEDNGDIGTDPKDLIESTNPNPWALDWNDHVPANFRLAMDGYFYMAVGDKGIFGATGRDGRNVFLHGGGILRIRPDGTGMEVYSTGVRNILDVALTSEDEIFTYDNTDEHDWMGRLTHMVDGGFYGYPHHFVPRRPYTLWMMHDFGGGAATGAFANTEDALPPEYHDNLFLADFGKRQIIRVEIERDGGTFKVLRHEELFSAMPDAFRPVGIAPSADGKSIYICDWQHRDTKENVEVGRLWKLTYTGKTFEQPRPSWYIPAALGKKFAASNRELINALSHPSKNVRLSAQRELGRRDASKELDALLNANSEVKPYAKWHALWALDAVKDREKVQNSVVKLASDGSSTTRRQAIRRLGHHKVDGAAPALLQALPDPDASVRFQAATALGRLAASSEVVSRSLLTALSDADHFARYAVVTALNRIGRVNRSTWPIIVRHLTNFSPEIRREITHIFRETYEPRLAQELTKLIRDEHAPLHAREAALASLAQITRKLPQWKGEWWAYHPALAPAPAKTVAWEATEPALALYKHVLRNEPHLRLTTILSLSEAHETSITPALQELYPADDRDSIREAILVALAKFKDTNSGPIIIEALKPTASPKILTAAISASRFSNTPEVRNRLAHLVSGNSVAPEIRADAISTLGSFRAGEAIDAIIAATTSSELKIRSAAISALGKVGGPLASKTLLALFDRDPEAQFLIAGALGELKDTNAIPKLLSAYSNDLTREVALDALLRIPHPGALEVYIEALGNLNPATRERARKALEPFADRTWAAVRPRLRTMRPVEIAELQKLYPQEQDLTLLTMQKTIPTLAEYLDFGLKSKGDADRGRRIFHDPTGVACIQCHTVAGVGNAVGPDMTTIGAQFPREALIEQIINPSASVREGYQQVLIETTDDESFSGLIKSETADTLTLLTSQAQVQTIPKAKITSRRNSSLSLMPEGLHLGLSLENFADLLAYLESLKRDPRTEPKKESKNP